MTGPRYLVARFASWTRPNDPPTFARPFDTGERWTDDPGDAVKLTAAAAERLRDDLADHSAHTGRGYAFAVVEEIDTNTGPAHRELTPPELAELTQ